MLDGFAKSRPTRWRSRSPEGVTSYESCLSDRPEELYLALLEYFEPSMDEYGEDFDEDTFLE